MAVRTILKFPDPRLRSKCQAVVRFDEELRQLAGDLLETLRAAPGVGIAAAHVGVLQRLVVLELDVGDGARIYANPEIVWASPDLARHLEGSISMPGVADEVERPARVRVRCQDLDGVERIEEADGFRAACLQHEIDQLDGIFWIQRLSRLKRDRLIKRFGKLGRAGG